MSTSTTGDTPAQVPTLRVGGQGGATSNISFDDSSFSVTGNGTIDKPTYRVPLRQVLWAACSDEGVVEVHLLAHRKKSGSPGLVLVKVNSKLGTPEDKSDAIKWTEDLMQAAYKESKRRRKLRVLINPAGGPGKAVSIFKRKVEPIFRAAQCELDVTFTERAKHGEEIARELPLGVYDAVVCLSGDGMLHEVFSGFAKHKFPMRAFRIPVAPVPTGSGNGTSLNLIGIEDGFDVASAALNAIKGQPMSVDLFSMTQGKTRVISFMSQALGLMADLDLGTEHLRWMGDTRFIYGYIREVVKHKPCPVKIEIKVAEESKLTMLEAVRSARKALHGAAHNLHAHEQAELSDEEASRLPELKYGPDDKDGWTTIDKPVIFVYAGQGPYVSRDLMMFPVSHADDGLIDVAVQELTSRAGMLSMIDGAENGAPFWKPAHRYYKAHAYRITPVGEGRLSVDGEAYPFAPFQVEVHRGLGTFLAPQPQFEPTFRIGSDGKVDPAAV